MYLYKYELINQQVTLTNILEVKENKSNYSLKNSPNKRIPFIKVNTVLPDEELILYLTEDNINKAIQLYAVTLLNQADVYRHTANCLTQTVKNLERNLKKERND